MKKILFALAMLVCPSILAAQQATVTATIASYAGGVVIATFIPQGAGSPSQIQTNAAINGSGYFSLPAWNNAYSAYAPSLTRFVICAGSNPITCYPVNVNITGSGDISSAFIGAPNPSGSSMTWPNSPGIMVYGGNSAYGTSLTAPTGAIVGTTDTQTLTNKTVDGVTPTVFGYVDPTSSIQAQLNGKANTGNNSDITSLTNITTINNTSQSYNATNQTVFFGANIPASTVGAKDTAYGYNVLGTGVTGYYNNAFGIDVLNGVTSGYQNTGAGSDVMNAGTVTGIDNNAFGFEVLQQLTSGDANNAFGSNALNSITAANNNSSFGDSSLQYITSGNDNVALGYHAGTFINGGTNNLTPGDSVFIGDTAEAGTDNDTNEIVVGYNAVGHGSNTATYGNSSTTDSYISGNLHATIPNYPEFYSRGTLEQNAKIYIDDVALSGGTATVTFGNSFAFTTFFVCTGNDSTSVNAVQIHGTTFSSITITGTGSDNVNFSCIGY